MSQHHNNTPSDYPTVTAQVPGSTYESRIVPYRNSIHLRGNRDNAPVDALSQTFTKHLYLPHNPVSIIANIGTWVLGSAFATSVVQVLPVVVSAGLAVLVACLGVGLYFYAQSTPEMHLAVVMRMSLIIIGMLLGVSL